ncbi:hypothetical protein KW791_00210 [Candidatus Parcubacteria bacterium]|nr:hypothetical protein [Candidatus Parcubacteria bacterium]
MLQPKRGAPIGLTNEKLKEIINAVPRVLVIGQIAGLCCTPRTTLLDWLKRGEKDNIAKQDTIFAQLSSGYKQALAIEAEKLLKILRNPNGKNKASSQWLLERVFRDDFGVDSEKIKELLDKQEHFSKLLDQILTHPLQGKKLLNGSENICTENDQAAE